MVMKSKQLVINAFLTPEPPKLRVWSSGKFACANQLVLGNDGDLVLSCEKEGDKTKAKQWELGTGLGGPNVLGKLL